MKQQFLKYLHLELEDDSTDFGGTSFGGETLYDFLTNNNNDEEINGITDDEVNPWLIECGILPLYNKVYENKMISNEKIADLMFSDFESYKENIKEIIVSRLMDSTTQRIYWDAWFKGIQGKGLEKADKGIKQKQIWKQ